VESSSDPEQCRHILDGRACKGFFVNGEEAVYWRHNTAQSSLESTPPVVYLFPSRLPPVYVIWYLLNTNIPSVGAFFNTYYGTSILFTISYKNHN
jgi:hypothetical protein